MKYVIFSILLFFSLPNLNAQSSPAHHLGLHAGSTTGLGFSYRYWPAKLGFQVTGIPIFNGDNRNYISGGVSLLYLFKENKVVDLFGYIGNHLILETNEYVYYYDYQTGLYETEIVTNESYIIVVGF